MCLVDLEVGLKLGLKLGAGWFLMVVLEDVFWMFSVVCDGFGHDQAEVMWFGFALVLAYGAGTCARMFYVSSRARIWAMACN